MAATDQRWTFRATARAGLRSTIRTATTGTSAVLCFFFLAGCRATTKPFDPAQSESSFHAIRAQSRQGSFADANGRAAQAWRAWKDHPESLWHWKFRLLYAELLLLNGDTRAADALLQAAPPEQFALTARYHMLCGYVLYRDGRSSEAEAAVTLAAQQAHAASDFELEADADLIRASYASPRGSGQAEPLIEHILRLGREHGLNYQMAGAWLDYGMLRIHQSRFAEAIPYFEQASEAAKRGGATLLYSIATGDLATCYYNLGDFDRSRALRDQAIGAEKRAGLKTALRDSYLEAGVTESLQGNNQGAIADLRQALALVDANDSPGPYSSVAWNLASVLESTGALDEAQQLDQRALLISKGSAGDTRAAVLLNEGAIAERRGHPEIARADYTETVSLSPANPSLLWSAWAALGSLDASAGRTGPARTDFEAALRIISQSRTDQLESRYKISFLSRLIRFYQEYVDFLITQGDMERALEIADSSRAGVLAQDLTGSRPLAPGALLRGARRISARSGSTLLFYWLAPKRSWLWVIHGPVFRIVPLPGSGEIEEQVTSYRYLLERRKADPLASSARLGSQLFEELVAPASQWILRGSSVTIVPDDALHRLNFESLVAGTPAPHYWIEDATVTVAPSLSLLSDPANHGSRAPSLLLIGDPDPAGTGFPALPDAAPEMRRVSEHFPQVSVTERSGDAASPAAYRAASPRRFSVIHFTAHAEANEQSPLDSAIVLSDRNGAFRLYAHDIMEEPLTADLVTISACRGAGARNFSGEGLVGFAWAFFQAGARNVVAGLWDVNDRSTSDLMDVFYSRVQSGDNYAEALRQAKLSLLKGHYPKPYYWAPFQLYSRGV